MVKAVISDFASIKWSAIKKNKATVIIYVCGVISIFNWLFNGKSISTEQKWIGLIQLLFLAWGICVHTCFPNCLSAPMYLVPSNSREKKKYLYTGLFLKQILISGPHMIYNLYLIITEQIPMWKGIFLVYGLFVVGIQQGISTRIDLGQVKKEYLNDGKEMLFLLLSLIMYCLLVRIEFQEMLFWEKALLGGTFLGQILLLPWIIKRIRIKMEVATDFQVWKSLWQKEEQVHENCN